MWKKLVSLNLALLMIFSLTPLHAAAVQEDTIEGQRYADIYRNKDDADTEHKTAYAIYGVASDGTLRVFPYQYLYQAVPYSTDTGRVVTTYNTSRDGTGISYGLTRNPIDVFSPDRSNPMTLYAQWEATPGNYILYLGVGVGPTKDGKDYILDTNVEDVSFHKPGTAILRDDTAFETSGDRKIVGWTTGEAGASEYFPGARVDITSNPTFFPILGINYIAFEYDVSPTTTRFQYKIYEHDILLGETDIQTNDIVLKINDTFFVGWNGDWFGNGQWYAGSVKDTPHELHAQYEAFPSEDFCILYSWLGLDDEKMCKSLLLTDGKVTNLPATFPDRYGYTFVGWYTKEGGKGTKVENGSSLKSGDIVYAYWSKNGNPPEDKTYTITISGGGILTTDSDGKLTALPTTPSNPGYHFEGWYTGPDGTGTKVEIGHIFTGNSTIYPYWKPDSSNPSDKVYIIIIDGGGQVTTGSDGKLTTLPATPTRPGYIFDGWYTRPDGGDRVTTDYIFTGPITIYPHWREDSTPDVTYYPIYTPDRTPGGSYSVSRRYATPGTRVTIELSPRSSYDLDWLSVTNLTTGWDVPITERYWDEYTFIMPSSAVEVDISYVYRYNYNYHYSSNVYFTYAEPQPAAAGPNAWYYRDRHIYHVTDGLVPDITPITRDMFISVLYNLTDHSVTDSTAVGSETNDSQVWATEHNIVPDIYVSGLWGQDKTITREQAAMLIFRYAGYRGRSTSQSVGLTRYRDYSRLNPIARTAMSWTLATGLMSSTSAATLSPQDNLTCGQAGDLIYRFVTTIA